MSTPTIENIGDNICDDVNLITTAAGFNYTLTCIRPTFAQYRKPALAHFKSYLLQDNIDPSAAPLYSARKKAEFTLSIPVVLSNDSTTLRDTICNAIAADVEKKLLADRTRGGYAVNTFIDGVAYEDQNDVLFIVIKISVDYMHKYGDPYTK